MINPSTTSIEKYEIIRSLGGGNFGDVFHVYDRALGAEKAIKILKATDPSTFMASLEEAQILNKCQHKNIVSINEANIFMVEGVQRVVLDLEYISGGSLENVLSTRWISVKESLHYIRGALAGLEHAHSIGFLHRDVKPGNILLAQGITKLSDFGLATDAGLSLVGSAQGYRPHLPPEYYVNKVTTVQSDIFAVGVTLYRAISNISDWRSSIQLVPSLEQSMLDGSLIKKLGFESFIPDQLKRIIRQACNPNPLRRFKSARDFGQKIDRIRINIDWIRVGEYEWSGYCANGRAHRCFTDSANNSVTYSVNNRRVLADCAQYTNFPDAVLFMYKKVSETTFG